MIRPDKKEQLGVDVLEDIGLKLVLFNDDFNTFEHVINCLQRICKHTEEQATQCAYIVHFKGKCIVKNGSENELVPMCLLLLAEGLSAEIEK